MTKITIPDRPVLSHMLNAGLVLKGDTELLFDGLSLIHVNSRLTPANYVTDLDTIETDFTIFETPDQLEIKRLQDIIKRQTEEIQKMLHPEPKNSKSKKHLSAAEVKDVQKDILAGATVHQIEQEYDVSQWIYYQIKLNKHKHQLSGAAS